MAARLASLLLVVAATAVGETTPAEASLELDPTPRRYDLRIAQGDETVRRVGWADGADARIGWQPPQARRAFAVGLVAGLGEHDDRGLRLRTADFALDVRTPIVDVGGIALVVRARYGVIALLASDADAARRVGLGDGGALALDGERAWGRARVALAIGYVAWRFTTASSALDASGWLHGPTAALRVAWRW